MKMILIDRNGIHIENTIGVSVYFHSMDEMMIYTGIDLRTKLNGVSVCYEPDRLLHTWFDGINTEVKDIPDLDFENLIDNVQVYVGRYNDPYYGMTDQEKADKILQEQKDVIAAQRYEMESSGITYEGLTVPTDRESVQILDSTCDKIRRGLISSVEWKCEDGYLTLTSSNIDALEVAVLTHVQTAFAWEKTQLESL